MKNAEVEDLKSYLQEDYGKYYRWKKPHQKL